MCLLLTSGICLQDDENLDKGDLGRLCKYYGKDPTNKDPVSRGRGNGSSPPSSLFLKKPDLKEMVEEGDRAADMSNLPRAWVVYARKEATDSRYKLDWKGGRKGAKSKESRNLSDEFSNHDAGSNLPDFSRDWRGGGAPPPMPPPLG